MLQYLRIRNLALLESIDLDFQPGFTAVTGETGAGKSILLGALALLSGARADKSVIRQGAEACEAEGGVFLAQPRRMDALLESLGLPPCDEGMLLLKRTVARDKPPRIAVNGSIATLANLQAVGKLWIDFHGPGEPRRLLEAGCQIELLDLFGRLGPVAAAYRARYDAWRCLQAEMRRVSEEARLGPDQLEFLRQQIARIDSIDWEPEALEALERDATRLASAEELSTLAAGIAAGLAGDRGVLGTLGPLVRSARQLASIDASMQPNAARLESLAVEAGDLAREFEAFVASLEFDPREASAIQARIATLLDLRRRHGSTSAAILQARERMAGQIAEQGDLDGTLARLEAETAAALAACQSLAGELRAARGQAGTTLARRTGALLAELGFRKAELHVALQPETELRPHGDARPEILFAPNPGEPAQPLARIASSGELARVMLALKTVLAEVDDIPVLVFDEVDANIGGEIGRVVGEKMAAIAGHHQVLCVTHLPQVASLAHRHLVVEKDQAGARAGVTIRPVHGDRCQRVAEIARMLGDRTARSALAHAEELVRDRG
jgi:DNA repair protein RecN (Recombination protein N)